MDRLRILEAAVREATDGVLITDADLDEPGPLVLFANQGFTQMTGYVPEEVVGRNPRILQGAKTDVRLLHDMGLHLRRGEPWTGQMVNYRKDGSEFLIELHISPVHNDAGEITHFVAIQRDVTERERAKEAQRVFEQMTTIARTAVTYNHEINNPVAALSGYAELLLRDETDPEKRENLQAILRSAALIA
ncbi:PAS domain-containing protein [Candidatus Poribacteria bacterium]|nr:PAS domain-containing protein [Candidatus Poribacteria bacterium]